MALAAVRLPDFGDTYDGHKMRALAQTLESVLRQVYVGRTFPYGIFTDSTDQTAASTTAAYAMTFNTTEHSNGVSVLNNSEITVQEAGFYNIQFSAQLANTDSQEHDVSIWFQKNGTPEANSNTELTVPAKHGSVDGHAVAAWNFITHLEAGEYVKIFWQADSTLVSIEALGTQTSPDRPATPSLILTVTFVSR